MKRVFVLAAALVIGLGCLFPASALATEADLVDSAVPALDEALVTPASGTEASMTDSAYAFAVAAAPEISVAEPLAVDPATALEVLYWGSECVVLVKDGVEYVLDFFDPNSGGSDITVGGGGAVVIRNLLVPPEREEGGLAATMDDIFGAYTPLTYEVTTYIDGEAVITTEPVPGLAGLDWPWLSGVALFALCAYSVFRLLGVTLK